MTCANPGELPYRPFPFALRYYQAHSQDLVRLHTALRQRDHTQPIGISGIEGLSFVIYEQFERVLYAAQSNKQGLLFWITREHARAIGKVLSTSGIPLERFILEHTCTEDEMGFDLIAEELEAGARAYGHRVSIRELIISHKSGDEVTAIAARGLGRWIHACNVETLHLWSAEYDEDSLDSLLASLQECGNTTLKTLDICNTRLEEPNDKVPHPGLEAFVQGNESNERTLAPIPSANQLFCPILYDLHLEEKDAYSRDFQLAYSLHFSEDDDFRVEHRTLVSYARLNDTLRQLSVGNFEKALSQIEWIERHSTEILSSVLLQGVFCYIRVRYFYDTRQMSTVVSYVESERGVDGSNFTCLQQHVSLATKSWVFSILSEAAYRQGDLEVCEVHIRSCYAVRLSMQPPNWNTLSMCCNNALIMLSEAPVDRLPFFILGLLRSGIALGRQDAIGKALREMENCREKGVVLTDEQTREWEELRSLANV